MRAIGFLWSWNFALFLSCISHHGSRKPCYLPQGTQRKSDPPRLAEVPGIFRSEGPFSLLSES